MYSYVRAVCLSRSIGSQWAEVNISNIIVYDIFINYSKVYLVLHESVSDADVYVDMDELKYVYSNYNDTLNALLIHIGNTTLTTVSTLPSTDVKFVKYSDAIRSQYKLNIAKIGVVLPNNYPESELVDLEITRPRYNTDLSLIDSHCLVSVNGFIHNTVTDGTRTFIEKGATTMRKSRLNHAGITSFLDVGAVTKLKIDKDDITGQTLNSPLSDRVYFTVPGDFTNKSVILSLGGYLVFPDKTAFWQNNSNSFVVDLSKLQYIERIFESNQYIDLSQLDLTPNTLNPDMVNVSELWSDDVIKEYFTLPQSFLIVVDVPNLVTNKIFIRTANIPGKFTTYRDPVYPLITNYGKISEYWKNYDDGFWNVSINDSFMKNYIVSHQDAVNITNVTNNLVPNQPFYKSKAFLLEISGYN